MDIDYDKIWDELIEEINKDKQQEGEYTIQEFASKAGIERKKAANMLDRMTEQGLLTKRKIMSRGGWSFAYKPIIKEK